MLCDAAMQAFSVKAFKNSFKLIKNALNQELSGAYIGLGLSAIASNHTVACGNSGILMNDASTYTIHMHEVWAMFKQSVLKSTALFLI